MRDFRQLVVWQKAHALTMNVYRVSSSFSKQHLSGLSGQMQRAAVSMATSIAEAAARSERGDFIKSLHTALGWANQLEYELLLSRDLGLVEDSCYEAMQQAVVEVKKMLNGMSRSIALQENH